MVLLGVLVGGAAGATARYLIHVWVSGRAETVMPWATLIANVAGSFVLGCLAGVTAGAAGVPDWVQTLVGIGFCGALTTYSTLSLETVNLAVARAWRYASINVVSTLGLGLGGLWLGWFLSS